MKLYNGLPIFCVDFTDETVWNNVSIVEFPAIEQDFIKLSKQNNTEIQFRVNEEKRDVFGPVLIPNQPIYRRDDNGNEYYIEFDAKTIRNLAIKFFGDNKQNNGNIEHSVDVNGVTFYQSVLLNRGKGIVPTDYEELPDGTWLLGAHIENDEVWKLIKDGTIKGFSIDMRARISPEKDTIETLEELMDYLSGIQ